MRPQPSAGKYGQKDPPKNKLWLLWSAIFSVLVAFCIVSAVSAQNRSATPTPAAGQSGAEMPRGQKLVLKDGSFQWVREYKVEGDKVSYYSLDTHQWEEMPAALIDWDATKKEAAKEQKQDATLLHAVDEREKQETADVLGVDASIEPAPGIFLPPDNGLFAFDGKKILVVNQADMKSSLSKTKTLEKIMVPVPIIPERHVISIAGTRAKLRMTNGQPEFYLRVASGGEPEIDLVRAKVRKNNREVEDVDELMDETAEKRKDVALQRWHIAENVYRYTIAKPLDPGEYVLVQNIPNDQYSIYLWDFAIDAAK